MRKWMLSLVTVGLFASNAQGAEPLAWPQFRGPAASGVAEQQRPPVELGPDKNVRWKVPVPSGFSSPIVVGDKLALTAFDDGKLFTIAYDRATGKELWRTEAPAKQIELFHKTEGSPAASTPATDGSRIVSYFGSSGLFCYELNGKQLWHYELPMAATVSDFGTGVSPVIADGTVILLRDEQRDSQLLALDLATGKPLWQQKRQSIASHATPAVWETPAGKQIVAPGMGRLIGYDLKSGTEKWWVTGMPAMPCASPVVGEGNLYLAAWSPGDADDSEFKMPAFDALLKAGDTNGDGILGRDESDKTFIAGFFDNNDPNKDGQITRAEWDSVLQFLSSSKNSALALRAGGTGDVTTSHVVWRKTKGLPYVPSLIFYQGQCVMVKDGGIVTAYDAKSGTELYSKRAAASGRYYASPVAANGNIYFTSLDDGVVTVMKAGGKTPEIVAKNPPLGERVAATPAIADNTLYVRTAGHLYAFAEGK